MSDLSIAARGAALDWVRMYALPKPHNQVPTAGLAYEQIRDRCAGVSSPARFGGQWGAHELKQRDGVITVIKVMGQQCHHTFNLHELYAEATTGQVALL